MVLYYVLSADKRRLTKALTTTIPTITIAQIFQLELFTGNRVFFSLTGEKNGQ